MDNLTPFSHAMKAEIDRRRGATHRGVPRQEDIARAIGRTQPYVSSRITGKLPWSTDDLDRLAPLFGETAFTLIASAAPGASVSSAGSSAPVSLDDHRESRVGGRAENERAVAKERTGDRGEE